MKWMMGILLLLSYWVCAEQPKSIQAHLDNYYWDAARNGDNEILQTFIEADYNLNLQDNRGYTAIILSAYHGHYETVKLLIKAGADPCLRDQQGNSALMGAIFKGEIRVARLLISSACSPDDSNNRGQTAAMYAALFKRPELLQALKQRGADLSALDHAGNSVSNLLEGEIKSQY